MLKLQMQKRIVIYIDIELTFAIYIEFSHKKIRQTRYAVLQDSWLRNNWFVLLDTFTISVFISCYCMKLA